MAKNTKIEWADHTFNPWEGCSKVSTGCKNCYAEERAKRFKTVEWGIHGKRRRTSEANWKKPLRWNQQAMGHGIRYRIFCASLADIFEDKPDQPEMDKWRFDLFDLIQNTSRLDWLVLIKRPENVMKLLNRSWQAFGGQPVTHLPPNMWIGTSVENQEMADKRIPELLKIPATVRFLSCEPLLDNIDLQRWFHGMGATVSLRPLVVAPSIHWVITGGESGRNARPMNSEWARSLRDQCQDAGVAFFMKQMGGKRKPFPPIPQDLMIREFPEVQK